MEKQVSYLARTYDDFRDMFKGIVEKYYPDMMNDFQDASVGQWFIDLVAAVGDDLSYHIDRVFQETTIDSANQRSSIMNLARSNGLRVPGPKSAMVEVNISCILPLDNDNASRRMADESYAPIIKKGSLLSTGSVTFQIMDDINFAENFNADGVADRSIMVNRNANGNIESYTYTKTALALAGEEKIYRQTISANDLVPFMEVTLQDANVLGVESIIFKDGTDFKEDPLISEFMVDAEEYTANGSNTKTYRYFEVESFAEQYRFGDVLNADGVPEIQYINMPAIEQNDDPDTQVYLVDENNTTVCVRTAQVRKGEWKFLKNKFITEYTDNGQLKIIFGAGANAEMPDPNDDYIRYQMSKMIGNEYLGTLPESGWTMFVLYRVGGGEQSNIASGTLTNFIYKNVQIDGNPDDEDCAERVKAVKDSISVTNPTPSFGGKDAPTVNEIKYLIQYNNAAQDRCVTLKDYYARLMKMPAKYGTPFRLSVAEENNKVEIYMLNIKETGQLSKLLPSIMVDNMQEYLREYRTINDFVEFRSGKICNVSFEVDVFIDKSYDKSSVINNIISTVADYMDVDAHQMGDDIFIGDLEKEITKIDGVISVIEIRVYNETGAGYSSDPVTQELVSPYVCPTNPEQTGQEEVEGREQIDLAASDGMLVSNYDTMFEILNRNKDIRVRAKLK